MEGRLPRGGQASSLDTEIVATAFDLGADRWHRTGDTLTDADLEAIKDQDVILLGAVGDPLVPIFLYYSNYMDK